MLKIKLARVGKKNRPIFRIIVQEDSKDPRGYYLEKLGFVDRIAKKVMLKKERILHWLKMGAQTTPSINNLLIKHQIISGSKIDVSKKARLRRLKKEQKKQNESPQTPTQTTATPQ